METIKLLRQFNTTKTIANMSTTVSDICTSLKCESTLRKHAQNQKIVYTGVHTGVNDFAPPTSR